MATVNFQYIQNPAREIFRAYDVRSVTGPLFNGDVVYTIAMAIGSEAQEQGESKIIIGRDGRLTSPSLGAALRQGLLDSGCDVIDIGLVPTPLVYFATYQLDATSGVMLTGSHNPGDHNGLKMVIAHKTLTEERVYALYERICANRIRRGTGTLTEVTDIIPRYVRYIAENVKLAKPLKIAVDCGNGVPGIVAPQLYRALGCEVMELFCEVDGHFPNHHPDPSVPANIRALVDAVTQHKLDFGVAFDGDGDRLGIVTNEGEVINPDRQMIVFAHDILKRHPGAPLVFDIKSTHHLGKMIKQMGGVPVMWKSGHSLIKNKMQEIKAPFAGEFSGHFFFGDGWFGFDDGIYAGARMLQLVAAEQQDAQAFFAQIPNSISTPEIAIPISDTEKFIFMEKFMKNAEFRDAVIVTVDGIRAEFAGGWGLVRASNTTPNLITRFEADDVDTLRKIQADFRQEILRIDPTLVVNF